MCTTLTWSATTEAEKGSAMSREEPTHPGEMIRLICIEGCDLTIAEAAAHMRVHERELAEICHARAPITAEMAVRIERAFGGSAKIWLALQTNHDLAQARKQAGDLQITRIPAPDLEPVMGD